MSNDSTTTPAAAGPVLSERLGPAPTGPRTAAAMTLPGLPTPRVLASGTIAGKRIELRGWHTEDIEAWERQHGLKFGPPKRGNDGEL